MISPKIENIFNNLLNMSSLNEMELRFPVVMKIQFYRLKQENKQDENKISSSEMNDKNDGAQWRSRTL